MKKNLLGISLMTMGILYGILAGVVILVMDILDLPVIYGVIGGIIVLLLQFIISPFLTDLSMRWFYKVKFDYEVPDYLNSFIDGVCKKYNMKRPRIGFINDGAPNAFTYGHTKNDARIVVTRGLFDLLDEDEVVAVVAHEMGHATHYDMLFMTVAQLVPLVLYGIYEMLINSDSDDNDKGGGIAAAIIAYILYVISEYIVLWLSRTREYYADSFAIEETRNPNALAEALVKVGFGLSTSKRNDAIDKKNKTRSMNTVNALGIFDTKASKSLVVSSTNHGKIDKNNIKDAMKWEMWNIWAKFYELSSTHPLISKRLIAISRRCHEFNQEEYIHFDLQKNQSYIGDFIKELLIKYIPFIALIITIVIGFLTKNLTYISVGGMITSLLLIYSFMYSHPRKGFNKTDVLHLLGEVQVSGVTSIPAELEGVILGRGNPGYIFNEDFIIQDETGIMFLDYNQPMFLLNKIFALFKSPNYFDKLIKVKGWYRRSPVPYIEILEMEIDGKKKKIYTYIVSLILYSILLIGCIGVLIYSLM